MFTKLQYRYKVWKRYRAAAGVYRVVIAELLGSKTGAIRMTLRYVGELYHDRPGVFLEQSPVEIAIEQLVLTARNREVELTEEQMVKVCEKLFGINKETQ